MVDKHAVPKRMPTVEEYFFEDVAQLPSINGKDGYLPLTRRIQRGVLLKRLVETSPEVSFQKILRRQYKAVEEFNRQCVDLKHPPLDVGSLATEIEVFFDDPQQAVPPTLGRSLGKRPKREDEERDKFEDAGWRCFYLLALFPPSMRTLDPKLSYTPETKIHFRQIHAETKEAKAKLVEGTMRYAINIARLYVGEGVPYPDLVQEGALGLMHAADRYDERRGHFQSYAGHWIKQRISRYISDHRQLIRVPVHFGEEARQSSRVYERLLEENQGNCDYWRFFQEVGWLTDDEVRILQKPPAIVHLSRRQAELKKRIKQYESLLERYRRPDRRAMTVEDHRVLQEIIDASERVQAKKGHIPDIFETFLELTWVEPQEHAIFQRAQQSFETEQAKLHISEESYSKVRHKFFKAWRKLETLYLIIKPIYSLERVGFALPQLDDESVNIADFLVDISPGNGFKEQETPRHQIAKVLQELDHREREILVLRYGLSDGIERTLEEVGQIKGVTRERIRQIEAKALRKLRHPTRLFALREYEIFEDVDLGSMIGLGLQRQLQNALLAHEAMHFEIDTQSQQERERIETLIHRYIPSSRKRMWRADKQSGRAELFREILLELGHPTHYGDIHIKAIERVPEGITFAKDSTYTTLFYHRYFRSFGKATFGLVEWETIDETMSGEKQLQLCPMPLLPVKTYPTAFFESVMVGLDLLKRDALPARQFWAEMVAWSQQESTPQDAFDAWYATGLIERVDYVRNPNAILQLTLSKDAKIGEARRLCVESLCRRVLKMPEILLTIDRIAQPTLTNIQKVLFGDPRAGFDVPQRLIMLTALDAVQPFGDEWRLTDIGRKALEANPPQALPDFGEIASFKLDEVETAEPAWQYDLDLMDL